MSDHRHTSDDALGSTQVVPVPTETDHGRTPAVPQRAGVPSAPAKPTGPDNRTPDQIERDIEAARDRLASTIDEISDRVKPANVAARTKTSLQEQFLNTDGSVKVEKVAPAAAAVAGMLLLKLLKRRLRRRKQR